MDSNSQTYFHPFIAHASILTMYTKVASFWSGNTTNLWRIMDHYKDGKFLERVQSLKYQ